jgi:hypothetical protein
MSFIQREIDTIRLMLASPDAPRWAELYAAQQALEWALEPSGVASPYQMIMGTGGGSEGYPPSSNPALSECASADPAG